MPKANLKRVLTTMTARTIKKKKPGAINNNSLKTATECTVHAAV